MTILEKIKKKCGLAVFLVLFVFAVLMITCIIIMLIFFIFHQFNILSAPHTGKPNSDGSALFRFSFVVVGLCILLGTAFTALFSKKAIQPIKQVIDAMHEVAKGNFDTQLHIKGIGELEELSHSFNKMTQELSSIETLRGDFVNNFSHEFKTPIVSMRGFAKLLKDENLTTAERQEYLDIIITESERLASLSTSILTLSKYETIEIVSDKTCFRLDEQIRRAIAITDPKWSTKNITMNVDLEEVTFNGNEDLLQQIWLNLLDNAIKFSNSSDQIIISLRNINSSICFSIQDYGIGMSTHTKDHMFDKFYQGDTSHIKAGNGLGLAMVKRIVLLCGGTIDVDSQLHNGCTFIITLPNTSDI